MESIQSLVESLRNPEVEVVGVSEEYFNYGPHPVVTASADFVSAERGLKLALDAVTTAKRELQQAEADVIERTTEFVDAKRKLASLLNLGSGEGNVAE